MYNYEKEKARRATKLGKAVSPTKIREPKEKEARTER